MAAIDKTYVYSITDYKDYVNWAKNQKFKCPNGQILSPSKYIYHWTDEELMEVCKTFENYFVEQVLKEMEKTVHSSDQESEYYQYFGDILTQSYAESFTESGQFGLAQTLYESMKRNM